MDSSSNLFREYKNISKVDANRLLKSEYKELLIQHYRDYMLDIHELGLNSHQQSIEDDLEILRCSHKYVDALDLAIDRNRDIFNSIIESYSK